MLLVSQSPMLTCVGTYKYEGVRLRAGAHGSALGSGSSEHDCSSVIQEIADLPRSITTASNTHPPDSTDHGHDHL